MFPLGSTLKGSHLKYIKIVGKTGWLWLCTSTAGINPALLNLRRSLLTLWAWSKLVGWAAQVECEVESFCVMTSMCAQCPCPFAAEGIKDRVSKTSHCPTCEMGLELAPFLADVQQLLGVALEFSSALLILPHHYKPHSSKESGASICCSWLSQVASGYCPPCALILQTVAFAYCVREVHPGLAILAQKAISQPGLVNPPHAACLRLHLWKPFVWGLTGRIWVIWKFHLPVSSPDQHKGGAINRQVTCCRINLALLSMALGVDTGDERGA